MGRLIAEGIAAVMCLGLMFGLGMKWEESKGQATIALAKGDTRSCVDSAGAQALVIDELKSAAITQRLAHDDLMKKANLAMREQLTENQRIADEADARIRSIQEASRHVECSNIDHLPLCAGMADGLWPDQTKAGSDQPTEHR